jgi:hypothetical protein
MGASPGPAAQPRRVEGSRTRRRRCRNWHAGSPGAIANSAIPPCSRRACDPRLASAALARRLRCRSRWPSLRRRTTPGLPATARCTRFETFRAEAASEREGEGLPRFVEEAFRDVLRCGWLAGGFARFRCDGCGTDLLVPFSCKGRRSARAVGGGAWRSERPIWSIACSLMCRSATGYSVSRFACGICWRGITISAGSWPGCSSTPSSGSCATAGAMRASRLAAAAPWW